MQLRLWAVIVLAGLFTITVTDHVSGNEQERTTPNAIDSPALPPSSREAQSEASPLEIQEHVLDNGLTILVVEDHRVPRVAANLWFRVGSMQEKNGQHGITHFLEHAIFQGTTTIGTRDFGAELPLLREIHETEQALIALRNQERNRLRERAVFYDELAWPGTPEMDALRKQLYELEDRVDTDRDFWASYKWYMQHGGQGRYMDPVPASTEQEYMEIGMALPPEYLELFFRMEADRMANAIFRGWEAQRYTVLEQAIGHLSDQTRFDEAIDAVMGMSHPVYQPDVGHLRDFANFTRADMLRIYDDYFVPNNAALVLVGDITLGEVVPLAESYFGRLPRGPAPPADMDLEAELFPVGAIRLDWTEPLSAQVHVRYRIPGMGHPDRPVFDLIAALVSGPHGLAGQRLARDGVPVSSVRGDFRVIHTYRFGSPGAFNLVASASTDGELPAVERALLATVDDLRAGHIDAGALARARKRLRVEWAQIANNPQELAFLIGHHQTMNHWSTLPALLESRDQATAEDVRRVATTYFVPSNRVIAVARFRPPEGSGPSYLDYLWSDLPGHKR